MSAPVLLTVVTGVAGDFSLPVPPDVCLTFAQMLERRLRSRDPVVKLTACAPWPGFEVWEWRR